VSRVVRWLRALVLAGVLAASGGCGQATPPGKTVPGLRTHLERIDRALAEQRYGAARSSLEALVRTTIEARATGRLSPEQADRILAAATRLTADLPMPQPTTKPPSDQQDEKKDEHNDEGDDNRTEGGGGDEYGGDEYGGDEYGGDEYGGDEYGGDD
jgi:hypothetical protein